MQWRIVTLGLVAWTVLAGMPPAAASRSIAEPQQHELLGRLESIPGLSVLEERSTEPGFRVLELVFEQPSDHRHPENGGFRQRLTLLHRGFDRPTVAHTSGYNLPAEVRRSEPAQLLDANQLSIEHRFFTPSRPEPADWGDLNIWQSATDEHRIIQAFRQIYSGDWITTGASKGGMTAVYHRRFYPDDVAGTVAYVAPNDVDNDRDHYDRFLAEVGTDPACRSALIAVQREALLRRDEMLALFGSRADANGWTFDRTLGDIDRALEAVVFDAPFAFWQYRGQQECGQIPKPTADTAEIYSFLDETVEFGFYTDQGLEPYVPYYYQSGTQLGWPDVSEEPLADLLHHRDLSNPRGLVPSEIPMRFRPGMMREIDEWVRGAGSQLMFVNGERDPWSAEPFRLGPGTSDSYSYLVPGGNHGAEIGGLPTEQRRAATATLRRWAGVEKAPEVQHTELDERPIPRRPL